MVVGQDDGGSDEHAVAQAGRFVDEGVVLDLAVVPQARPLADVGATPHDAARAQDGVLAHLRQVPDAGALADDGLLGDVCGRVDACAHAGSSFGDPGLPDDGDGAILGPVRATMLA